MLDLLCRQHGLSEPIPIVFSYVECHNTCNISTVLLFLFLSLDEVCNGSEYCGCARSRQGLFVTAVGRNADTSSSSDQRKHTSSSTCDSWHEKRWVMLPSTDYLVHALHHEERGGQTDTAQSRQPMLAPAEDRTPYWSLPGAHPPSSASPYQA